MAVKAYNLEQTGAEVQAAINRSLNLTTATQSADGLMSSQDKQKLDSLDSELAGKVDKVPGKGLSTNDYDNTEKQKVADAYQKPVSGIPASDLEPGVIPDVSQFITKSVNDLANYYLKTETYAKNEVYDKTQVDALIAAINQFSYQVVSELPEASASTMYKFYLIPSSEPKTQNIKDEYITVRSGSEGAYTYAWEQIGSTAIDLTGYVTTEQLTTALSDYTTTANLTTLLAAKQDTISDLSTIRSGAAAGATAYQKPSGGIPKADLESGVQGSLGKADTSLQYTPSGAVDPSITPATYATNEQLDQLEAKVTELEDGSTQNYTPGKRLNSNGTIINDSSACLTDYIPYTQGNKVVWTWSNEAQNDYTLCFYNASKQYISGAYWGGNVASGNKTITSTDIATYAPNAAYLRATVSATYSDAEVEIGDEVVWTRMENFEGLAQVKQQLQEAVNAIDEEIEAVKTGVNPNYTSGKYLTVVGNRLYEQEDEEWGISDYIPYNYSDPIKWRFANTGKYGNKVIAFYNNNKEWIANAYWGGNNSSGIISITSSDIQTYAQNAAFIRASFKIGDDCFVKENDVIIWEPQEGELGLQMLQGEISGLNTRVTALEGGDAGNPTAALNKFKESAIVSIAAKIGQQIPKVKDNFLCFLHISDIHGDAERMKRAIAFANSQNNITAILATGDFSQSEWNNNGFEKTFTELYQTADIPMLPVIGNHDVGLSKKIYSTNPNTNSAVGARFISPFMTALGCVQGGTDAGYYHKDFSSFKVRLIVVNEYEMPRVPNSGNTELKYSIWGRYFSQAQADWLVSTLNSVQSGWSVIIATHQLIDVFSKYDNEFKGAVNYSNADVELAQEGMLQDIVDAYIAKGTLTKTYSVSGADTTEVPEVSVSADFSGANGEFICYINGHTHNDGTGQSSYAQAKQVNINVTTGSANISNQAVYDDLYRDNDTIAQDAFNLVAFDTTTKKIRMLRIGANVTMDMKRRDYALIPYSQS